jgi:hypothetical protein
MMPSSDNAGRIEYLTEYQHIDEGVLAKLPFATYEKILPSRTLPNRSPGKITAQRHSVEMTFVGKYKVLQQEMLPHKHLESSAVIFITFNSRACHLNIAVLNHNT